MEIILHFASFFFFFSINTGLLIASSDRFSIRYLHVARLEQNECMLSAVPSKLLT